LEDQITIGASSDVPHNKTGEAGTRRLSVRKWRLSPRAASETARLKLRPA